MSSRPCWIAGVVAVVLGSSAARAATLFVDDFDLDPSLNAWTEFIDQGTETFAAADILATGAGEAWFKTDYDGTLGADNELFHITRTINAAGFSNLVVALHIRENTTVESSDNIKVQIDTGSGFVDVAGVSGDFGTAVIGPAHLGPAANNSTFTLRVASFSNAEDLFLDRIEIYESATTVLYSDGFTLGPAASGSTDRIGFTTPWTIAEGDPANGTDVVANGSGQAVMQRTTVDSTPDADDFVSITHAFSTVGFQDITVQIDASQSGTTFESTDYLQVLYTVDGINFTSLLKDFGVFHGNQASNAAGAGNTTGAAAVLLIEDPLAANNPNFAVRIEGAFNADPEQYRINGLQISGTAISEVPTPSSLAAGVLLMAGLVGRRR